MTRSKPTFHVLPVRPMAALIFALLFLGLFHGHAGASSAVPDIRLNGVDGKATVASDSVLIATVQLDAGDEIGETADWWIFVETPMGWYYYEYSDMWHFSESGGLVLTSPV